MFNKYEIRGDVAFVFLENRGKFVAHTLVDAEDIQRLVDLNLRFYAHKTSYNQKLYARATDNRGEKVKTILLHRFIVGGQQGKQVDHYDGNSLNNRKNNLFIVDCSKNMHNKPPGKANTSGVKGVSWIKKYKKWYAVIKLNKKIVYAKYFNTIQEAEIEIEKNRKRLIPYLYDPTSTTAE